MAVLVAGEGMKRILVVLALVCAAAAFAPTGLPAEPRATDLNVYRDPDQLAKLIAGGEPAHYLVDVRTAEEFEFDHIPSAINIPVGEIRDRPPTDDKGALIIVYCASGGRSARAAAILVELGYTAVVDFGGISRWTGEIVSDDPG
jgi:rhodanese-related sulfurtransferase